MPGALPSPGPVVSNFMSQTTQLTDAANEFIAHPSPEPFAFQTAARSRIKKFTDLENAVGKTGADLQIFAMEQSEKLERASSWYGKLITLLYLLGLSLTVVTGIYGIEAPKPA